MAKRTRRTAKLANETGTFPTDAERPGVTGPQLSGAGVGIMMGGGVDLLGNPLPRSYETYRQIRRDPTVALARALAIAPVIAGEWSIEEDDDAPKGAADLIYETFVSAREPYIQTALEGGCDFGWQPFEKIFGFSKDGWLTIKRLKPLLQDITQIVTLRESGAFAGFQQFNIVSGSPVILPLSQSFNVAFRVEGTQWHGQALLENIREEFVTYYDCEDGAKRYDKKLAGSHWVVHHPPGSSMVNGAMLPNDQIADAILGALRSSGSIRVPMAIAKFVDNLNSDNATPVKQWIIEILSDTSSRQPAFVERLKHCEARLVRGLLVPERSVLEGSFGTKAEAGVHAGLAVAQREVEHRHLTRMLNWHCVDQVLALNWSDRARGTVRLKPAPLIDEKQAWLRGIYEKLLATPTGAVELSSWVDYEGLSTALGVPMLDTPIEAIAPPQPIIPGVDPNQPQNPADGLLNAA